ncbi:MAG: sugar phosphate isomerase/epimerase [Bacteroidota bacterium]
MADRYTRREWTGMALTGLGALMLPSVLSSCKSMAVAVPPILKGTAAAKQAADIGIVLGAQTYSFRDHNLDDAIKIMTQLGIKSCELWNGHVQPRNLQWAAGQAPADAKRKNEEMKKWRASTHDEEIKAIRTKFENAGITIMAYTDGFRDNFSEQEIEQIFQVAKLLGTDTITTSATVSVMKRVDVYAQKYKIKVGMHGHSHVEDPNEFSSPDSFARGMAGCSEYIGVNLDIGHFTAAGFDAVDYIKQHHDRIFCIHVKDRKKNQGENQPLGQGDTPIGPVLKLIRDSKYPIPADIEYEYKGGDSLVEVGKCLDYCKQVLKA